MIIYNAYEPDLTKFYIYIQLNGKSKGSFSLYTYQDISHNNCHLHLFHLSFSIYFILRVRSLLCMKMSTFICYPHLSFVQNRKRDYTLDICFQTRSLTHTHIHTHTIMHHILHIVKNPCSFIIYIHKC